MSNQTIGLAELMEKVKADLLSRTKENPFLFVDSVELELQVVLKKEGEAGLEVDVIGIGGTSLGGNVGQEQIQTVKVSLSPLFTKEELKEYYKAFLPDEFLPMVKTAMSGSVKHPGSGDAGAGFGLRT